MIHGPRKTAELLASAKQLRDEEKLIWRDIAMRIGVDLRWLMQHKSKIEGVAPGLIGAVQKKDLATILDKARTLRKQGARWKAIGKTLGVEWQKLYQLNRYHTNETGKK